MGKFDVGKICTAWYCPQSPSQPLGPESRNAPRPHADGERCAHFNSPFRRFSIADPGDFASLLNRMIS